MRFGKKWFEFFSGKNMVILHTTIQPGEGVSVNSAGGASLSLYNYILSQGDIAALQWTNFIQLQNVISLTITNNIEKNVPIKYELIRTKKVVLLL
jgi:hypothetical protein